MYNRLRSVWKMLKGVRGVYLYILSVTACVAAAEGVLHPLLLKYIFDEAILKKEAGMFASLVVAYLLVNLILNAISLYNTLALKRLMAKVTSSVAPDLLKAYYSKPWKDVSSMGSGYYVTRIAGDLNEGLIPLLALVNRLIEQVTLVVAFTGMLFYLSWEASMILAGVIPIAVVLGTRLGKRIRMLSAHERELEGKAASFLTAALDAFRLITAFRLADAAVNRYQDHLRGFLRTTYERHKATQIYRTINGSITTVCDFLSLSVGAFFVLKGALTFGAFFAYVNSFWRCVSSLMAIFNSVAEYHRLGELVGRLIEFLRDDYRTLTRSESESLVMDSVTFSYREERLIEKLSLKVECGEVLMIRGSNGSGKTTVAHLMAGLLEATGGELRRPARVSCLTLPLVFPPLPVSDLPISGDDLRAFAMPDASLANAMANELSMGQKQRVGLAMALSMPAELYILDEPTANLDIESRRSACELIKRYTDGKMLVLITHADDEPMLKADTLVDLDSKRGQPRGVEVPGFLAAV